MHTSEIQAAQIVFLLLLAFAAGFAALARKLRTPYPIVLVIAGLLLSLMPGIPKITLQPDLIFFVVLPPLLYSAAWLVSWRDFKHNLVSILSLAVGLVGFTVLGVAEVSTRLLGFGWSVGWVLGAVVAPTDAIAATAIAKRLGLPQRIIDVLEGESLINDATGLLALQFGTAMIVSGQAMTVSSGLGRLLYLTVAGTAIGLAVGRLVEWFEHQIDDGPIEIAVSILVPYACYLAAEQAQASGVLAVVACGLFLSRKSSHFFTPTVRLQAWAVWESLVFILNGLVFVLLGLQLPHVRAGIPNLGWPELLSAGALFSAVVIGLRLAWVFPASHVSHFIRTRILKQRQPRLPARQLFVVGWTGMRGVVSLAAALSLPETLADGSPFPGRSVIVFLTFSVILVTLVLQGLTLPWVIRALKLASAAGPKCEEREARRLAAQAALDRLRTMKEEDDGRFDAVYADLEEHYNQRLTALSSGADRRHPAAEQYSQHQELSRRLIETERRTAIQLRNEGRISDEILRLLERELDLAEAIATSKEFGHRVESRHPEA